MPDESQLTPEQRDQLGAALRAAQPSWEREGAFYRVRSAPVDRTNIKRWDDYTERTTFKYETPDPTAAPAAPIDDPVVGGGLFDFQMFDATDEDGSKVRIQDGLVYGPNDDGTLGDPGMGSDTFTIDVWDGADVYLAIVQDIDTLDVLSINIAAGATPDDVPDSGLFYKTIGNVSIDEDGNLTPINTLCGDYVLDSINLIVTGNNDLTDLPRINQVSQINFSDAFDVEADATPNPDAVFVDTALSVGDGTDTVEHVNDIEFSDAFEVGDGGGGQATVETALSVEDPSDTVLHVNNIAFSDAFEVGDGGGGEATVETALSVEDESAGAVAHVNDIAFTTFGDANIDVVVTGSTGSAQVAVTSSADLNSTLADFESRISALESFKDSVVPC